jgi:hypothetical protein
MTLRRVVVVTAAALVLLVAAAAANGYSYPRFQPVSIAFLDEQHGVLAEDDWTCQKARGCQGRLLVTSDGGAHIGVHGASTNLRAQAKQ